MRLLDLFCGAGGAAWGYHQAGWSVIGCDIRPQPHYPFRLIIGDALEVLATEGHRYDAVHASPPCQRWCQMTRLNGQPDSHPDLLTPTLRALESRGGIWVVENVMAAPFGHHPTITLCGLSFGLRVFRHRRFACSHWLWEPPHVPHGSRRVGRDGMVSVYGGGGRHAGDLADEWRAAMGITWMPRRAITQAIPPAYTHWIGRQIAQYV